MTSLRLGVHNSRVLLAILAGCWFNSGVVSQSSPLFGQSVPYPKIDDQLSVRPTDWPWWRGPLRNGVAPADQHPPQSWSETKNVRWKVLVPGRGHSSPIVVGQHVVITTGDRQRDLQSVLCYDRESGKLLWETVVHRGGLMYKNEKASAASSTVASDGERYYVNFLNAGHIYTTALDLNGKQIWQTKVSDYIDHQGFGSSPCLYQQLVLVSADHKGGGVLAALSRKTGELIWKRERPATPNYPSPIVVHVNDQDQLILTGCDLVSSYDPLTGKTLWELPGATTECVTSTITDGLHIYSSGGYPDNHMSAIRADGSKQVAWRNKERVYVPSLLIHRGHLYGVLDAGVAVCWDAQSGKELWKSRLGGTFSASPVLVGDLIYASNEEGSTFIWKASPSKFELVEKNELGRDVFATPTIVGGHIYCRVAQVDGDQRQEILYCLGTQP